MVTAEHIDMAIEFVRRNIRRIGEFRPRKRIVLPRIAERKTVSTFRDQAVSCFCAALDAVHFRFAKGKCVKTKMPAPRPKIALR
jgi:hypothetical protein